MRMQPSWHANEILEAISNDQQAELKRRLAHAAEDCRETTDLPSLDQELYSELEACVETLASTSSSLDRCGAALQLLRHLAETGTRRETTTGPARGSFRSAATASFHR
jgi:hypothetical protein